MGICGSEESKPRRPNNNTNPYSNSVNASKKSSKRRIPKPPNYFIQDDFCIISPIEEDYKISQVIGRGANGTVSIAQNQEGKAFAIKEIFKSKLENKKLIRNEAYVNMNVNHKNIAKCYAIYEDQESIFFVLDLIEGGTLLDFIMDSKDGHLTEEDALDLLIQILETVNYLHYDKHIVHRDIKPENFLIVIENDIPKIKLIDFGFSCPIPKENYMSEILGTPSYMAPEIIEDGSYTKMADLWSVGIIFYNMLTGNNPFYFGSIDLNNQNSENLDMIQSRVVSQKINFDIIKNKDLRGLCEGLLDKIPDCRLNAIKALEKAKEIKMKIFDKEYVGKDVKEKEEKSYYNKSVRTKATTPSSKKTSVF